MTAQQAVACSRALFVCHRYITFGDYVNEQRQRAGQADRKPDIAV